MIGRLAGILLEKNPPHILIDCQGVGYDLAVPMSTFYNLPNSGESCTVLTQLVVREDAHTLYGFLQADERAAFRALIRISGVGPRTALSVLSGMSVADLVAAVQQGETARIVKVPGIGKKTAERLVLELKGSSLSAAGTASGGAAAQTPAQTDIVQALMALGYSEKDAASALKSLPADVEVSDGIRQALKALAR